MDHITSQKALDLSSKLFIILQIRLFNGFSRESATIKEEKIAKVTENKKKWTVVVLKDCLGLFGLEKSGTRDELVEKLCEYLMKPLEIKKEEDFGGKGKSSVKSKGTKRKAKGDAKVEKKKRPPSAYILFSTASREVMLAPTVKTMILRLLYHFFRCTRCIQVLYWTN